MVKPVVPTDGCARIPGKNEPSCNPVLICELTIVSNCLVGSNDDRIALPGENDELVNYQRSPKVGTERASDSEVTNP